jgi:ectoine hydroxylase-related dioxygenase (phytanoyl-CoA dioxygenase family)
MAQTREAEVGGVLDTLNVDYPVTDEQISSLHEHSWALLPGLLSNEVVEEIRQRLAVAPQRERGAVSKSFGKSEDVLEDAQDVKSTNISHDSMAWRDDFFRTLATSRRVAGTAVRLMRQPTALLAQDVSFIKPPGGTPSHLHQDFSYFPLDRKGEVSLWIALVDMSTDMGPLHYVEDSHLDGPLGIDDGSDIREVYPQLKDRQIVGGKTLAAGDAQAHWDLTIHGANTNVTSKSREAYVVRYMRSDTVYTGIGHPHFDSLDLRPGTRFLDSGRCPLVGPDGLLAVANT